MTRLAAILGSGLLTMTFGHAALAGRVENTCAQAELKALGYYTGEVTGRIDAATRAAGDDYIAYMTATYPGWAQAPLAPPTAGEWCRQLAAAYPEELSSFLQTAQGSAGLVHVTGLTVKGAATVTQPYDATFDFNSTGDVSLTAVCFVWNARDEVCLTLPDGTRKGPITAALTTGRAGTYNLNAYVKYDSNGKSFKSPETSFPLTVE